MLAQVQGDREKVIAYGSRSLHPGERSDQDYSAIKLELLGLKWAIVDKFKDYLWGAKFQVFTDHRPLVHLQTAKLGATEQRWVAQLSNYEFTICYRPGATNQNADALFRMQEDAAVAAVETSMAQGAEGTSGNAEHQEGVDWGARQGQDQDLALLRSWKVQGGKPSAMDKQILMQEGRALLKDWDLLVVEDGKLMHCGPIRQRQNSSAAILVPAAHRRELWVEYHRALGTHVDKDSWML